LALAARDQEQLRQVAEECRALGAEALALPTDVRVKADVDRLVAATLERYCRIDILVNNAGVARHNYLADISEADWDLTFDVNVKGVFLCTQAAAPHMIAQHGGRVINISSGAGLRGSPRKSAYSAAKFAVIGFADSLAQELGPHGIAVNTIAPGPVATEMRSRSYPFERPELLPQPEEVAKLAVFLASDDARTIHNAVVRVATGPEPIPIDERQPGRGPVAAAARSVSLGHM
jgi:NAD(P)-dependent dehydrogenase (short-subunit alcohol dehydrogenase family)